VFIKIPRVKNVNAAHISGMWRVTLTACPLGMLVFARTQVTAYRWGIYADFLCSCDWF